MSESCVYDVCCLMSNLPSVHGWTLHPDAVGLSLKLTSRIRTRSRSRPVDSKDEPMRGEQGCSINSEFTDLSPCCVLEHTCGVKECVSWLTG